MQHLGAVRVIAPPTASSAGVRTSLLPIGAAPSDADGPTRSFNVVKATGDACAAHFENAAALSGKVAACNVVDAAIALQDAQVRAVVVVDSGDDDDALDFNYAYSRDLDTLKKLHIPVVAIRAADASGTWDAAVNAGTLEVSLRSWLAEGARLLDGEPLLGYTPALGVTQYTWTLPPGANLFEVHPAPHLHTMPRPSGIIAEIVWNNRRDCAQVALAVEYGTCAALISPDGAPPTLSHLLVAPIESGASRPLSPPSGLCAGCPIRIGVYARQPCAFALTVTSSAARATALLEGMAARGHGGVHSVTYFVYEPPAGRDVLFSLTPLSGGQVHVERVLIGPPLAVAHRAARLSGIHPLAYAGGHVRLPEHVDAVQAQSRLVRRERRVRPPRD